jgi:hypothetical protein
LGHPGQTRPDPLPSLRHNGLPALSLLGPALSFLGPSAVCRPPALRISAGSSRTIRPFSTNPPPGRNTPGSLVQLDTRTNNAYAHSMTDAACRSRPAPFQLHPACPPRPAGLAAAQRAALNTPTSQVWLAHSLRTTQAQPWRSARPTPKKPGRPRPPTSSSAPVTMAQRATDTWPPARLLGASSFAGRACVRPTTASPTAPRRMYKCSRQVLPPALKIAKIIGKTSPKRTSTVCVSVNGVKGLKGSGGLVGCRMKERAG